jgi:hypothetical protein
VLEVTFATPASVKVNVSLTIVVVPASVTIAETVVSAAFAPVTMRPPLASASVALMFCVVVFRTAVPADDVACDPVTVAVSTAPEVAFEDTTWNLTSLVTSVFVDASSTRIRIV